MIEIARTTIGRQAASRKCVYPIVRLPKSDGDLIGKRVTVYESSHDGARAFLVVLEESAAQQAAQFTPVTVPTGTLIFNNTRTDVIKHQGVLRARGLVGYDVALTWRRS